MSDKQVLAMLQALVEEIDYDLYKEMFVPACILDKHENRLRVNELRVLIRQHLDKAKAKV